ncbi:hypothetical protein COTS27_00120 [Spirochaetota bacterium]|nr:hypothetical protein COTS27_00120 [Spirochaetota bacterium]
MGTTKLTCYLIKNPIKIALTTALTTAIVLVKNCVPTFNYNRYSHFYWFCIHVNKILFFKKFS